MRHWYKNPQHEWWELTDLRRTIMGQMVSGRIVGTSKIVVVDKGTIIDLPDEKDPRKEKTE